MVQANPYPLRIEKNLMNRIKELAKANGRSVNKEIEYALQKYVKSYEK